MCDRIYILSAKYGLIHEDTIIEPYNMTLNDFTDSERRNWADKVLNDLRRLHSLTEDEYVIIAGMNYCEYLLPHLCHHKRPLQGVPLGRWIPVLKALITELDQPKKEHGHYPDQEGHCDHLHDLFSRLKRYNWNEIDQIPFADGIYILFERGEFYKNWDRITRIGTHTADGNLRQRLRNHFIMENKDGSIFRKNIGLALLNKVHDPYLKVWGLDTSKPKIQVEYASMIDIQRQLAIERQVTEYLRMHFTFTCIPVAQMNDRLRYEEAILSTLAHASGFHPSPSWLGLHNPKEAIIRSGLWNYLGLDASFMSEREIAEIDRLADMENLAAKIDNASTPQVKSKTDYVRRGFEYRTVVPRKQLSILPDNDPPEEFAQPEKSDSFNSAENMSDNSANKADKQPIHDWSASQQVRRTVSSREIQDYVRAKIEAAKKDGHDYIDLVSGNIHRELGLRNCMPSVCGAMRQVMNQNDVILQTTPSGYSSTITIRYWTR